MIKRDDPTTVARPPLVNLSREFAVRRIHARVAAPVRRRFTAARAAFDDRATRDSTRRPQSGSRSGPTDVRGPCARHVLTDAARSRGLEGTREASYVGFVKKKIKNNTESRSTTFILMLFDLTRAAARSHVCYVLPRVSRVPCTYLHVYRVSRSGDLHNAV